jgi:AcrR family transcriptional regulator
MSVTARRLATEETRARVLRAAREVFAANGYAGASMRQIAASAGLTAMASYTYAASKADLFQMVYDDGIARIYAEFSAVVADRATLLDEVEAVLQRGGQLLEDDPDLLRFTMRVATEAQHDELRGIEILPPSYRAFFDGLVQRAVRRGDIAAADGPRVVAFVTMLLWGITIAASIDPAQVRGAVATAVWAARGRLSPA